MQKNLQTLIRQAKILIVDDQQINITILETFLQDDGYFNIHSTTDPRTAVALYRNHRFDIVLLDLLMPHLDGFAVMEQLQAIEPDNYVPILVLSVEQDQETRIRALKSGARDFLNKPFNKLEVLTRIENMLEVRLLYQRLRDHNRDLEQKVLARTQALKEANIALTESNRIKSEFLGRMSHELRTPLNAIVGYSELLLKGMDGPLNTEQIESLRPIAQAGERMTQMVEEIMNFTQINEGKLQLDVAELDLGALLAESLAAIMPMAAQKGLVIIQAYGACQAERIEGDRDRLKQSLVGLLSNAVKFTAGGEITLSCAIVQADHPSLPAPARQVANRTGRAIIIAVKDCGIGIGEDDMETIFEPFHQIDGGPARKYEGIGLGLSMAKQVVAMHHGDLWVESALGQGSTFSMALPVSEGKARHLEKLT